MIVKCRGLLAWIIMSGVTGCAVDAADEPSVEAESPAISPNAISPNAISPNAISPNAISPNAISPNALAFYALSGSALSALTRPDQSGDLSREFLRYAVGCAFNPDQSFQFSWIDNLGVVHAETYWGLLGLAPTWAYFPLNDAGQRAVSACLAARTNYTGSTVLISMRSEISKIQAQTTLQELFSYNYVEGAFWGNLFAPKPHLHACYVSSNASHSRAAKRECANGHIEEGGAVEACGPIVIEGPCSALCSRQDSFYRHYDRCLDNPASGSSARTSSVITTVLP